METASSFQGDVCCPFWSFFMHVSLFIAECMNCTHNYCALCCAAMMSRCFPSASTPDVKNTGCSYRTIWELIYYLEPTVGSLTFPAFWSGSTPHWASTCHFHQQSRYSCSQLDYFTQQRQVLSLSVDTVWLRCEMLKGQAKYNCVLDFRKHKLGSAERKAREHVSAPGPWSMVVKCLPCFLGSHRSRSGPCGSLVTSILCSRKSSSVLETTTFCFFQDKQRLFRSNTFCRNLLRHVDVGPLLESWGSDAYISSF